METEKDVAVLHQWLDSQGIPRSEKEVPWEDEKTLTLSARIARLFRETRTKEYANGARMAELLCNQEVKDARQKAILEAGVFVWDRDPAMAEQLMFAMGLDFDVLTRFISNQSEEGVEVLHA